MTEKDKLLIRIGTARDAISRKTEQTSLDYMIEGVLMDCSVMLKEQEEIIRCKDCKYGEKVPMFKYYPDVTLCNKHIASHNDDWFCADGERAE